MNGLFLSFFPHVNDSIPNNINRLKTLTHILSQPHMKKVAASSRLSTRSLPKHFRTSHNSIQGQRSSSYGTGSWSVGAWRGGFSAAGAGHQERTICLSTSPAGLSDSTTSLSALAVFAFSFFLYLAAALAISLRCSVSSQALKKDLDGNVFIWAADAGPFLYRSRLLHDLNRATKLNHTTCANA